MDKNKVAGPSGSFEGHKHSPETLQLMSEQRKGKPKSDAFKKTISKMYEGKSMKERTGNTEWTCKKKGKNMKEITGNENWVDPRWGRKHDARSLQKMSDLKVGSNNPRFDPEPVTLFHKKLNKTEQNTRYEWRNQYGVDISKLESGYLKTTGGWALPNPPSHERTSKSSPRIDPIQPENQ